MSTQPKSRLASVRLERSACLPEHIQKDRKVARITDATLHLLILDVSKLQVPVLAWCTRIEDLLIETD